MLRTYFPLIHIYAQSQLKGSEQVTLETAGHSARSCVCFYKVSVNVEMIILSYLLGSCLGQSSVFYSCDAEACELSVTSNDLFWKVIKQEEFQPIKEK